jgi:hypothetical protein
VARSIHLTTDGQNSIYVSIDRPCMAAAGTNEVAQTEP